MSFPSSSIWWLPGDVLTARAWRDPKVSRDPRVRRARVEPQDIQEHLGLGAMPVSLDEGDLQDSKETLDQ